MWCTHCGEKLIKKYNIEYHKRGKVTQLSRDRYVCPKCYRSTTIKEELECSICGRKIDRSELESRIEVTVGKKSYTPETWDICPDCRVA